MSLIFEKGAPSFGVDFANFGSDGTGFVFIDRSASPPELRWFWSRTMTAFRRFVRAGTNGRRIHPERFPYVAVGIG